MTPVMSIAMPKKRFDVIHLDLVGPLPSCNNYTYVLTIIDRFTRWPDAIPITGITTEIILQNILLHWIARYGVPSVIITDRGAQFTSKLWHHLWTRLGVQHRLTTSYHPQSNGMIERFHRQLKAALRDATSSAEWTTRLSFALLGIRTAFKQDLNASAAEYVFGETLRLPGDFVQPISSTSHFQFLDDLQRHVQSLSPSSTRPSNAKIFIHPDLTTAEYVLLRKDGYKPPLSFSFDGPYKVISRKDKTFVINRNGRNETVSLDRLKPAFVENPSLEEASDDPEMTIVLPTDPQNLPEVQPHRKSSRRRKKTSFYGV